MNLLRTSGDQVSTAVGILLLWNDLHRGNVAAFENLLIDPLGDAAAEGELLRRVALSYDGWLRGTGIRRHGIMKAYVCAIIIICAAALCLAPTSLGQSFSTVINIPPDLEPAAIGSDTQINVFDGGALGEFGNPAIAGDVNGSVAGIEINVLGGEAHARTFPGTAINVSGGTGSFDVFGGSISVVDGTVQNIVMSSNGQGVIAGGIVKDARVSTDGLLRMLGGALDGLSLSLGSNFLLEGGVLGSRFGSRISLFSASAEFAGGRVAERIQATNGNITFSGGRIDASVGGQRNDVLTRGGEFRLNGTLVPGLDSLGQTQTVEIAPNDRLTGALADGNPFFSRLFVRSPGIVTLERTELPTTPPNIEVPQMQAPSFLHPNQELVLNVGGTLPDWFSTGINSTLSVQGGTVGPNLAAAGSNVEVLAGSIGFNFDAFFDSRTVVHGGLLEGYTGHRGSTIEIHDGIVEDAHMQRGSALTLIGGHLGRLIAGDADVDIEGGALTEPSSVTGGSSLNLSGGRIEAFLELEDSVMHITGGTIAAPVDAVNSIVDIHGGRLEDAVLDVFEGTVLNVFGGHFGDDFDAFAGSRVNFFGPEFFLDGVPLDDLMRGETRIIVERGGVLSGRLTDGRPFDLELRPVQIGFRDSVSPDAVVTVTLVPEPATASMIALAGWLLCSGAGRVAPLCRRLPGR